MCPTALKYNLTISMGYATGREVWVKYLERFVMTIYATGPFGVLVAYFVLRVEVSFDRVAMTLWTHTSLTKTAAVSVAASAFGSKYSFVMTAVRESAKKISQGNAGVCVVETACKVQGGHRHDLAVPGARGLPRCLCHAHSSTPCPRDSSSVRKSIQPIKAVLRRIRVLPLRHRRPSRLQAQPLQPRANCPTVDCVHSPVL